MQNMYFNKRKQNIEWMKFSDGKDIKMPFTWYGDSVEHEKRNLIARPFRFVLFILKSNFRRIFCSLRFEMLMLVQSDAQWKLCAVLIRCGECFEISLCVLCNNVLLFHFSVCLFFFLLLLSLCVWAVERFYLNYRLSRHSVLFSRCNLNCNILLSLHTCSLMYAALHMLIDGDFLMMTTITTTTTATTTFC